MSKTISILFLVFLIFAGGYYLVHKKSEVVNAPAAGSPEEAASTVVPYLKVPDGFHISIFARDVPGARVMEIDPVNNILVSETSAGKIVSISPKGEKKVLLSGLNKPHGLAMSCRNIGGTCFLYVAEHDQLSRYEYGPDIPLGVKEKLMSINSGITDRHFTRSLLFLPSPDQDTLLISVGSSCDVCHEKKPDYAQILFYNAATGEHGVYAQGLRNATFMTLDPIFGKIYATEMGRDNLGDDIPPDEINIIENKNNQPQNYGWPNCYGKNIHDDQFDKNTYIRNPCMAPFETPSFVDLPAHSAPLGLAFIPEEGYPEEYWYNLLVAFHGSWNRSTPTGYKIVRLKMNAKGEYLGTEDFITGWTPDGKKGRPVDIKVFSGGTAYISDDTLGVIYKLSRTSE